VALAATLGAPVFPGAGVPDAGLPEGGTFNCELPVGDPDAGFGCVIAPAPVAAGPYYCVYPGGAGDPRGPGVSRVPYDWRSPVTYADDLAARSDVKLLLLQDAKDALIAPSQACELAARVGSFTNIHLTDNVCCQNPPCTTCPNVGNFSSLVTTMPPVGADPTPPTGCDPSGVGVEDPTLPQYHLDWGFPGPSPVGTWPSQRYLLVFEGSDHILRESDHLPFNLFKDWVNVALPP
jgi:hypothetical protein